MKLIRKFDDIIELLEHGLLTFLLIVMISLGFLQVVLRNFFDSGFTWADVFLRHVVLWAGLIGASLATKNEKHLNMDALSRVIPEKSKKIVSVFLNLIACATSGLFTLAGYYFVKDEYQFTGSEPLFLGIPAWIAEIIIPVAFGIISIRFFIKAIEKTILIFSKDDIEAVENSESKEV